MNTLKMEPFGRSLLPIIISLLVAISCSAVNAQDDDFDFDYSRGAVPEVFAFNQSYPNRSEVDECRPIRLHIERGSRRFLSDLVTNVNPGLHFAHADARIMTSRLQVRLNALALLYYQEFGLTVTIMKSWTESGDEEVDDPLSLHFEGTYHGIYHRYYILRVVVRMRPVLATAAPPTLLMQTYLSAL